jgi:plastocyanin
MAAFARRIGLRHTLVLAAGIVLVSCSSNSTSPSSGPTITIQDFTFSPATLTVKAGTTVQWVNNGPSQHTTTSDPGDADQWSSSPLSAPGGGGGVYGGGGSGGTFSHTFMTVGTFGYHCSIHPPTTYPTFVGSVVVTP